MGIFDRVVGKPVRELFIASPADGGELVYRYPEQAIPSHAKVTVRTDEVALFYKQGRLAGTLEPGIHVLDTGNIAFLGSLIVTPLTGGNHFITELFFVRTSELVHRASSPRLGTFTDVGSRHLVTLGYRASVTLRVTNAAALVTGLAGQRTTASENVREIIDARLSAVLASVVGRLASAESVLQIASNQFSDDLGAHVVERAAEAFASNGLSIVRCLELVLALDPQSEQLLRTHGQRLAELSIQRETVQLAEQPGYAAMHLIQGQRALLEGMGAGAAQGGLGGGAGLAMALGSSGLVGIGGGIGRGLGSALGGGGPSAPPASARLPQQRAAGTVGRWYFRTGRGVEGPYTARQLVLRAAASGLDADSTLVRSESGGDWLDATAVDDLVVEFGRRSARSPALPAPSGPRGGQPSGVDMFERSLEMAVADAVVTEDELAILCSLCEAAGLAASPTAARAYVLRRATALGCAAPAS